MRQEFEARLIPRGPGGAWVFLPVPFSVAELFGTKGRLAVCGTLNGAAFRNSLLPEGDGTHVMAVSKALQQGAGAKAGDVVRVVMERDVAPREVELPAELAAALAGNRAVADSFAALSVSHRQEYADWVGGAKKAETRESRAAKALDMILARRHTR